MRHMADRYFDDFAVGDTFETATVVVTAEDISDFARRFDPQPWHLDLATAAASPFGGLAASGWHTTALTMRLIVDSGFLRATGILGLGVDDLRWMKPVRAGDTLRLEGEVVELVPSRTKPQGIVRVKWTAYNQHGEAVYTFNPIGIVPRRPG